ncbi:MAG: hypothetical protein KatS3mg010_1925 [Acidimicrobiia bacterium]|nr:MAG: hypothetical protein KatS3mg010_1925 [Acidimicrobiia bacterium]
MPGWATRPCGVRRAAPSTGPVRCSAPTAASRSCRTVRRARRGAGNDSFEDDGALVEIGEWPRLQAQILRRRLETAGIPVMIEWTGTSGDATGVIVVPEEHGEFAAAVVHEIDVDDEVPDTSPHAYVARIEEHLSAAAGLLDELRTRLDDLEAGGRG